MIRPDDDTETPAEASMREADERNGTAPKKPAAVRKTALDQPRGPGMFLMFPEDVLVAGVDYPSDLKDPLYDERASAVQRKQRPHWDPDMVDDIAANGVRVPITVVKDDGDRIVVNAGRRRVLHARAANEARTAQGQQRLRLKVIVEKGDAKTLFLMARRENAFRVQDTTLAKARNADRAIQQFGSLAEEVAASEGVSAKTVREWVRLLELAPEVHEVVETGAMSTTAALAAFKDIERKEQGAHLRELIAQGKLTVAAATQAAETRKKKKAAAAEGRDVATVDEGEPPPPRKALKKLLVHLSETRERKERIPLYDNDADALAVVAEVVEWVLGARSRKKIKGLSATLRDAGVTG